MEKRKKPRVRPRRIQRQDVPAKGPPMYRTDAIKRGEIFYTYEMIDWLCEKTNAPHELSEALLGAWVGVLRHDALLRAENDERFSHDLRYGHAAVLLNEKLFPIEWSNDEFWAQISHETGLVPPQVDALLQLVREKLFELKGATAFEPLGYTIPTPEGKLQVRYWTDFLLPFNDDPEGLIYDFEHPPLLPQSTSQSFYHS